MLKNLFSHKSLKLYWRFPKKAETPSLQAFVLNRGWKMNLSNLSPSDIPVSSLVLTALLAAMRVVLLLSEMDFASFNVSANRVSFLKTSATMPISFALYAGIKSPVNMYLEAITLPAIFANL